jgi:hypothetical protein
LASARMQPAAMAKPIDRATASSRATRAVVRPTVVTPLFYGKSAGGVNFLWKKRASWVRREPEQAPCSNSRPPSHLWS